MRYFFLHIIFLCCTVSGYGQAKLTLPIDYNGKNVPLTISIEDNAVSKLNSNTIRVEREKLKNQASQAFNLKLKADKEFPLKCTANNLEITPRNKIPQKGVTVKVVLRNINPSIESTVTLEILNPDDNSKVLATHTINVQSVAAPEVNPEPTTTPTTTINTSTTTTATTKTTVEPTPVIDLCAGKKYEERLKCLKDNQTPEVQNEINNLEDKKTQIRRKVNTFKERKTSENTYMIRCNDCNISDYEILPQSNKIRFRATYWKVENLTNDFTVTIRHKSWKSLRTKIRLKHTKPTKKVVEEDEPKDIKIEIDSPIIENIEQPEVTTNPIDETNIENKKTDTKFDIKKYWWLILIALPILFLLMRGLNKSEPDTEDIEEVTVPNTPKPIEPMQAEKTDEIPEIQIQEIEKGAEEALAKLPLAQLEKSDDFVLIDLKKCWKNTTVSKLYFSKESIREIAEMVGTQNAYDPSTQSVEELSEIGGFLLGHFYLQKKGEYYVSISTFVPITPEVNDRYTVKFGDEAWVELDDAYKSHPGERLVGWFHTHPGHGLFLSNADIKVHTEAFQEKYQFAMEIDPTTPGCDTAFFTWKKDNTLNNQKDRIPPRWDRLKVLELHSKEN